jgi:hypothetical protein
MRRLVWILIGIALLAALWVWIPSALVQRSVAAVLRERLQPSGALHVRARASAPSLLQRRVERLDISAAGVRVGEVTADGLTVALQGLQFERQAEGTLVIASVQSGSVELRISQANLEAFLRGRGVESPLVSIDESGVTARGTVRAGPVTAAAQLRGRFVAVNDTDLLFRIDAFDVSGMAVPGALATAILGTSAQPIVSLRGLPVPATIERVTSGAGQVVVLARVGRALP